MNVIPHIHHGTEQTWTPTQAPVLTLNTPFTSRIFV